MDFLIFVSAFLLGVTAGTLFFALKRVGTGRRGQAAFGVNEELYEQYINRLRYDGAAERNDNENDR